MPEHPDQLAALRHLLATLREQGNRFYAPRLDAAGLDESLASLDDFYRVCPLTTKDELAADHLEHPPYGSNLTFPLDRYTRYCQTSGTTGQPMRWLDTNDSWQAMLDCWRRVYDAAGCAAGERVFFAFSFGPFLGFWTAFEAATQLNYLAIPGGGMSSAARLQTIFANHATTLCCTPTYAIHLARAAAAHGYDLQQSAVARLIVAGEPGGSLPATRDLITRLWHGARVVDHHGLTEVGPVTFEDPQRPRCLRVMTDAYLHEVLNPDTQQPVAPGEEGELVLTTLRRTACPLLRYRTGDLVRADPNDRDLLVGGILGRIDDMVSVRGVNVYPAAVEQLVRQHPGVVEYQVTLDTRGPMAQLSLLVEPDEDAPADALCAAVASSLRDALHLRIDVTPAAPGSLPRYELKAKRWKRV
ncbi:MAG: AMP-binding protein [Planctomycetes bacterium]|jgi:phenylacetate-CoA ligase|nr:AMP-binding protein [Planctomycetota bacterium]